MVEIEDEAEGWQGYEHKGQKQKYYIRAKDAIKMALEGPRPIFIINESDLTVRLKRELAGL
jgi:hypothetical protein